MMRAIIAERRPGPPWEQFYEAVLAPLGYEVVMEMPGGVGFGIRGKPDLCVSARKEPHTGVHVALRGDHRAVVDAFYAAAPAAGGRDNGPPRPRAVYHPNYYGAFVFDPKRQRRSSLPRATRGYVAEESPGAETSYRSSSRIAPASIAPITRVSSPRSLLEVAVSS